MTTLKQIDVAWSGSLYEPSSDNLLAKIELQVAEALAGDIIVIRTNADCHDYSNSWLQYLRGEGVWRELMIRLNRWFVVMAKIQFSKAKWFFMADGDVVGSWWELACAFHGRVVTNPYAKVGFPETYIDLFPPLGILGLKRLKAYENPSNMRKNAILHAKDAFKIGAIDLCLLSDDWTKTIGLEHLKEWFQRTSGDQDLKQQNLPLILKGAMALDVIEASRYEGKTRRIWLEHARIDSAFDMLRDKNFAGRVGKLAELRAAAATRFLMTDYIAWLSRRVARYRLGLHDRWWSSSSDLIAIDISKGLPPQEIVKAFLLRRKRIVFTSNSPEKLRVALEAIRSRFDRSDIDGRSAYQIWEQSVSWVCTSISKTSYRGIVCEFQWDDTLVMRCGGAELRYLRISGNHSKAGKGWYEDLNVALGDHEITQDTEEIFETISLIANGILRGAKAFKPSPDRITELAISNAVRFVFLEYLLRLCSRMPKGKNISDILKMLSGSGWGFAADPYQWEGILKTYKQSKPILKEAFTGLLGSSPWKLDNVSRILDQKAVKQASETSQDLDLRSGASVSRYLEIFAHALGAWLLAQGYVSSSDEADLFVTLSLGYPGLLSLPQSLKEDLGVARLNYWLEEATSILS